MRALILICFLGLSVGQGLSQGIFHYYTGLILPDKDAPLRTDRLGIDFTFSSWLNLPEGIKVKPYSFGVNVYRIYDIPFGHSPIGIGIGYGFSSHNIHHNGNFSHTEDSISGNTITTLEPYPSNYDYTKNKISVNYFEVPFELRFRSKRKKNKHGQMAGPFRFYPGFKVGYLVNIHTSRRTPDGRFKEYNFFAADKLRYGATLRIGYGKMSLFGFYSLSHLFKTEGSTELQPFSVGLSFLTF